MEGSTNTLPVAVTTNGDAGDDEDGPAGKKKNNYRHLIKSMPGKHSMKKDDYLTTMAQTPSKQRVPVHPFDERTQREAFTVTLEGLKGFNIAVLVGESAQAKEDRKKRKELRRMQKTGVAPIPGVIAGQATSPTVGRPFTPGIGSVPATTPRPTLVGTSNRPTQVASTAQPSSTSRAVTPSGGTPRSVVPRPGTSRAATPAPTTSSAMAPTAGANTALPPAARPAASGPLLSTTSSGLPARPSHPLPARPVGAPVESSPARGVKRERDDSAAPPRPEVLQPQQHVGSPAINGLGSVRPGIPGAKPRPIKKQRMDSHGLAREIPVQQPTPQGV